MYMLFQRQIHFNRVARRDRVWSKRCERTRDSEIDRFCSIPYSRFELIGEELKIFGRDSRSIIIAMRATRWLQYAPRYG